ncbi:hypothetical protein DL764_002953 [Monosporascus ibericus]|uniref:Uncharacterized protein n=1 Tax=Monosporascus ibericus TaxID=155417 RepID=A0A4Q4TID8_9PEZI|nr:hypothetical protein DL764_002953 [Monosporascus ibericus]
MYGHIPPKRTARLPPGLPTPSAGPAVVGNPDDFVGQARGARLSRRDDEVLSLHGYGEDPLKELGKHPKEKHKLAEEGLRRRTALVYIRRVVHKKLEATGPEELAVSSALRDEKPLRTEGDLLVAWWRRLAISHIPADSERTITVQNAYSLRKVLQQDPAAGEALRQMRSTIKEQGNREQIEAYKAAVMEGVYPLPAFLGSYSNWTQADLFSRNSLRRWSSLATPLLSFLCPTLAVRDAVPPGVTHYGKGYSTTTTRPPTPSAEAAHDSERISWIAMTLARLAPNPLFGFYATEIARRNLPPESFKPRPVENRNDEKPNE